MSVEKKQDLESFTNELLQNLTGHNLAIITELTTDQPTRLININSGGRVKRGGVPSNQLLVAVFVTFFAITLYFINEVKRTYCPVNNTFLFGPLITAAQRFTAPNYIRQLCGALENANAAVVPSLIAVFQMLTFTLVKKVLLNQRPTAETHVQNIVKRLQETESLKEVQDMLSNHETIASFAAMQVTQYLSEKVFDETLSRSCAKGKIEQGELDKIENALKEALAKIQGKAGEEAKESEDESDDKSEESDDGKSEGGKHTSKHIPKSVYVLGRTRNIVRHKGDRKQYVMVNKKLIPLSTARAMEKAKRH